MPTKGSLIYHLTCLKYVPYFGKLRTPKITSSAVKEHLFELVVFYLSITFVSHVLATNAQNVVDSLRCSVCLCWTFVSFFSLKSCFLTHVNSNKVHFKLLLFLNIAALRVCVEDLRSLRPYSSVVRFAAVAVLRVHPPTPWYSLRSCGWTLVRMYG